MYNDEFSKIERHMNQTRRERYTMNTKHLCRRNTCEHLKVKLVRLLGSDTLKCPRCLYNYSIIGG